VIIPVNVGLIFGDGAEKIESDNTDLTINSGGNVNIITSGGNVVVTGGVIPSVDATYTLGDSTHRYTDLYLDSIIHHEGDLVFKNSSDTTTLTLSDTGTLAIVGNLTVSGSPIYGLPITIPSCQFSQLKSFAKNHILCWEDMMWFIFQISSMDPFQIH